MMNKTSLILKYFQKKDLLVIGNKDYQKTISSLFMWLIDNDKVGNDISSKYFPNKSGKSKIIAKQDGIIAGLEEIKYLLKSYTTLSFKPKLSDGQEFKEKDIIAEISGKSHEILAYERTILNILQRMSGIATETNKLNYELRSTNQEVMIAATRKTPWMSLDKKAVAVGGGLTHRLNLSDGILIKDNHLADITIEKALETLLKRSHLRGGATAKELIEVEVVNGKQARDAIKTFQKLTTYNHLAILLDNFSPASAKKLLSNLPRGKAGLSNLYDLSGIIFEASGGIDENNILEWSKTGVDIISLGSLTHSTNAADLSLEFVTI